MSSAEDHRPTGPVPRSPAPAPADPCPAAHRRESGTVMFLLAAVAVVLAGLRLSAPELSSLLTPALLAVASGAATAVIARHSARLPRRSARPWRALALVSALLTLGQLVAAVRRAGVTGEGGWADLPQLAAVPAGIAACLFLLPPRSGRTIGSRVLLDAVIVLVAVTVLGEVVLADLLVATDDVGRGLLTIGYPAVGALMCGVGLVAVVRVDDVRRRAATWLLGAIVAMTVVALAGAVGRVDGSAGFQILTELAWTAMLAAGIRAVDADPGQPAQEVERPAVLPLCGIVLSNCAAYGVALVLVLGLVGGRSFTLFECVAVPLLVVLSFARSVLWAADGQRLTRRLLRTEAYFRALVHSAEDVTVVVDAAGAVTWVSGAVRTQLGWTGPELTGRRLIELVHAEDGDVIARVVAGVSTGAPGPLPVTVRLRTRADDWRDVEVSGTARAGVPGTVLRDGLVLHLRDVTARHSSQRELERMAYTDYLTGLPNRARFMAALDAARGRAGEGELSSVLLIDLDGFKSVNDVGGHQAGDRLLEEVADQLRSGARDGDLVARLGGDEFALLVRGGVVEATGLAERMVVLLDRSFRAPSPQGEGHGPVFVISGSIGVAELHPGDEASQVVRQADLALRAAKAAGKGCVRSSGQTIDNAMGRRTRLARDLPVALEEGQLRVLYQPVVGIADRRVLGVEALVRWHHPLLGTVPPDEFIGLAEDDGLIVPLQRWVLERSTADIAVLLAEGRDLKLGVNVSVRHLQAGCLAPDVVGALSRAGVPPRRLIVEVTESVMMAAEDRLESDLATLHDMGCLISLDDFGRGYSSLAYLARLPVDILKMDRGFVAGIDGDSRSAALVGTVIELGRTLGMDVVAEGVETTGELAALQALGCRYVQGFLLSRPIPADELGEFIDGFDASLLDVDHPTIDALPVH